MSQCKRAVKVLFSDGVSWTSRKGAHRLVARGLAREIDLNTIEMREADYRYLSSRGATEPPAFEAAVAMIPSRYWGNQKAPEPEPIMDSGINCFALPWPLSKRHQGTRGRRIAA